MKIVYEKLLKKRNLQAKLNALKKDIQDLKKQVDDLEAIMISEQKDVDQLEKFSFTNLMSFFSKEKEIRLNEEREEAYMARTSYENALRRLHQLEEEKHYYEAEISSLKDVEIQFEKQTIEKINRFPESEEMMELKDKFVSMNVFLKNLEEAMNAGEKALEIIEEVNYDLMDAKSWVDVSYLSRGGGGGYQTRQALTNVEKMAKQLQKQLQVFKQKLALLNMKISVQDLFQINNFIFSKTIGSYSTLTGQMINANVCLDITKEKINLQLLELDKMLKEKQKEQIELENVLLKILF